MLPRTYLGDLFAGSPPLRHGSSSPPLLRPGDPIRLLSAKVCLVDAWRVNEAVSQGGLGELQFVSAGNPGRFLVVPEGEIWLGLALELENSLPFLMHEHVENTTMNLYGLSYNDAHDVADAVEARVREEVSPDLRVTLATHLVEVAERLLLEVYEVIPSRILN